MQFPPGAAVQSVPFESAQGWRYIDSEEQTATRGRLLREFVEFLAVGGGTLLLIPLFWLVEAAVDLDRAEYQVSFLAFYGAYLINDPHFSVTYLLFYRNVRERALSRRYSLMQRARYWAAGLVVPIGLMGWAGFAIATRSAKQMGLLFQLMFFLVSWHYVKQAFGILMVLSARRRVRFQSLERRLLLAHCLAAWFYARAAPRDPGTEFLEQGVIFQSIPHPGWLLPVTAVFFWLSAAGVVWALASFVRREKALPPLGALTAYLVTVWIWVVFNAFDPLLVYVIPALHSIQYLYFVWLQRKNEAQDLQGEPHFGRPVGTQLGLLLGASLALGWLLFHGVPENLDELFVPSGGALRGALGPTPFMAAFFAFVNIHHYFMDAVIWRREVPETRYLMY